MSSNQQILTIQILREMKMALDAGVFTQGEFDTAKKDFLCGIKDRRLALTTTDVVAPTELDTQPETQDGSKLYLIVKPEQAGKTMEVLQRMVCSYRTNHTISIIFCDNSLLQVAQTTVRAGNIPGLGKICQISSSPDADASNTNDLYCAFEDQEKCQYTTITCCAHSTQIHININDFLIKMARRVPLQKFEIYFDEASKVAVSDKMSAKVREWCRLSNVEKIYFIDATPESKEGGLFSVYADVTSLNLCCPRLVLSPNYVGIKDFDHIEFEPLSGENSVGYAKRILDACPLKIGDYAFIPASFKRKSHNEMRDMLIVKGSVVVVLNGDHKGMSVKHETAGVTTITEFDEKQIQSSSINEIIEKQAWSLAKKLIKPLVITGGMVPGRGLSFQKEGMLFTRGIFGPNIATNAKDRSQKAGRIKGNIRYLKGYRPCKVHSSKKFYDECILQEDFGRWLQSEALKGQEGEETKMNKNTAHLELNRQMVKMGMKKPPREENAVIFKEFETQEQARKYIMDLIKEQEFRTKKTGKLRPGARTRQPNTDGFYEATLERAKHKEPCSYDEVVRFQKGNTRTLGEKNEWKMRPCYRDLEDKSTLVWTVAHLNYNTNKSEINIKT